MRYTLKEATPRQNNIELPIAFLITETHKEYTLLYGKRKTITERFFSQTKTTQRYDEWFAKQDDTKIPLHITPLHCWFAVPGVNISKDYWENFFTLHPESALALHFHTKTLHKEKLTPIRQGGYPVRIYWTSSTPNITEAIPLSPPITYLTPEEQLQATLATGNLGFVYNKLIPIHITFHSDEVDLTDPLPNLIFEFIRENFILYRTFIASPYIDYFADNRILTGFGFKKNRDVVRYYN